MPTALVNTLVASDALALDAIFTKVHVRTGRMARIEGASEAGSTTTDEPILRSFAREVLDLLARQSDRVVATVEVSAETGEEAWALPFAFDTKPAIWYEAGGANPIALLLVDQRDLLGMKGKRAAPYTVALTGTSLAAAVPLLLDGTITLIGQPETFAFLETASGETTSSNGEVALDEPVTSTVYVPQSFESIVVNFLIARWCAETKPLMDYAANAMQAYQSGLDQLARRRNHPTNTSLRPTWP